MIPRQTGLMRHALKNAFLPVLTLSGWQFGTLLAGTVIIETIFGLPGMGRLLISSILHRDYTTIQATIMVITVMVLALNLVIDLVFGRLAGPKNPLPVMDILFLHQESK